MSVRIEGRWYYLIIQTFPLLTRVESRSFQKKGVTWLCEK